MKHEHKKSDAEKRAPQLWVAIKVAATLGALAIVAAVTFNSCRQQYTLSGPYAREYEGRVVDKSQTITESQTGSRVSTRLLIEGRGGERFLVAVSENTYERAQKGMWIKKTEAGVELTWPMFPPESPATETLKR